MALLKMSFICYLGVIHTTEAGRFLCELCVRELCTIFIRELGTITSNVTSQPDTLKVVCESAPNQLAKFVMYCVDKRRDALYK